MFGLIPLVATVALILIFLSFHNWARRRGLLASEPAEPGPKGKRRISLLAEAVAYLGAILILAGGGVAIGQRWNDFGDWGHVGVFAVTGAFFLLVGVIVRQVAEPAIQRLVSVVWFLSVWGVAAAAGIAAHEVYRQPGDVTALSVGAFASVYAAALWVNRQRALQNAALFAGLIVTVCATIATIASGAGPHLPYSLSLWALGVAWAVLGWRRYLEPMWATIPLGVVLALAAPGLPGLFLAGPGAVQGWVFGLGIATAAVVMGVSVPLRNAALLALGATAMFGYVTGAIVRYFHATLGIPAALAITGVLIIGLALVTARLLRATRPAKAAGQATEPHGALEDGAVPPAGQAAEPQEAPEDSVTQDAGQAAGPRAATENSAADSPGPAASPGAESRTDHGFRKAS